MQQRKVAVKNNQSKIQHSANKWFSDVTGNIPFRIEINGLEPNGCNYPFEMENDAQEVQHIWKEYISFNPIIMLTLLTNLT